MKPLTVRGIPSDIERVIHQEAREKKVSLNKALLFLLEKAAGKKKGARNGKTLYHDLDRFSGVWTKADEKEFAKAFGVQRKVDEALWK